MDYFSNRKNVDLYSSMMEGYDNRFIIEEIQKKLPIGSTLLELGMGTGADLISLSEIYKVMGSDNSPLFVSDFKKKSKLNVCVLDAVTVDIDQKFDCIFSNKVLQHLSKDDFSLSLKQQSKHLNENGILFFTLWHGKPREEFEFNGELRFVYYDEPSLQSLIPNELTIENIVHYAEFENNDSMLVVLRLR